MHEIADDLRRWLDAGESIALATVITSQGPSPRQAGAMMAVCASGQMSGSVSGGCVEGAIFEESQAVLAGGSPKRLRYGVTDEMAWEVGLACGGTIEVYVEPFTRTHSSVLQAVEGGRAVALGTWLDGRGHALQWPDGSGLGDHSLQRVLQGALPGLTAAIQTIDDADAFVQTFAPPPELIVVGAVHIAIPLTSLAQTMGYRVRIIDPRRTFATRERFPTADELDPRWPQDALVGDDLGPQQALVVLSHDPKFDLPSLRIALRSHIGYIGLLGSKFTQEKRRQALRDEGFSEEELARIHGPVGLDLGGRAPAEIALAAMAEVVAVRYGASPETRRW
jgi:xanthine dehydrogenase accessory factor